MEQAVVQQAKKTIKAKNAALDHQNINIPAKGSTPNKQNTNVSKNKFKIRQKTSYSQENKDKKLIKNQFQQAQQNKQPLKLGATYEIANEKENIFYPIKQQEHFPSEKQEVIKHRHLKEKINNRLYYQQKLKFNHNPTLFSQLTDQLGVSIIQNFISYLEINSVVHESEKQRIYMNKHDFTEIIKLIIDLTVIQQNKQIALIIDDYYFLRDFAEDFVLRYSSIRLNQNKQKLRRNKNTINMKIQPIKDMKHIVSDLQHKIDELKFDDKVLIQRISELNKEINQLEGAKVHLCQDITKKQEIMNNLNRQSQKMQKQIEKYTPRLNSLRQQIYKLTQEADKIYNYPITQQKRILFKGVAQQYVEVTGKLRSLAEHMRNDENIIDPQYQSNKYPFKVIDKHLEQQFQQAKKIIFKEKVLDQKDKQTICDFVSKVFRIYNLQYQEYKSIFAYRAQCSKQLLERMNKWGLIDMTKQGCLLQGRKSFVVQSSICKKIMTELKAIWQGNKQYQTIKLMMRQYLKTLKKSIEAIFLIYHEGNMFF